MEEDADIKRSERYVQRSISAFDQHSPKILGHKDELKSIINRIRNHIHSTEDDEIKFSIEEYKIMSCALTLILLEVTRQQLDTLLNEEKAP